MAHQQYEITFVTGNKMYEYGTSEQDIRDFIARSYAFLGEIKSIKLVVIKNT